MDTTHELDPAPLEAVGRAASTKGTADAALLLAAAGVPVFPCVQGSTRPLLPSGPGTASSDLDRVDSWWSRYPATNVAIPTGAASGLDVVEIYADRSRSGISAVRLAMRAGLLPRPGLAISTPAGGLHLLFPHSPQTAQPSWDAPRPGLSFHGDGGHILLPPSLVLRADGVVARSQLVGPGNAFTGPVHAGALRRLVDPAAAQNGRPALAPTTAPRPGQRRGHTADPRPVSPAGAPPMFRPDPGGPGRRPSEVVSL
ncbi:bifunctional DNA primase/polymerase [Promicromonospora sp. NPDC090134]|uniref:bifunctional DNA primase/polymerase n=1 Tax=Promicromonospora sp. NPDC090134 TaxID=3364408 RepID=UPI003816BC5A